MYLVTKGTFSSELCKKGSMYAGMQTENSDKLNSKT